ncbi:MAG TPA: hypothetical protein P5275_15740 [Saprospiraceae bacterium]|nr:hypothetical protein [Saprospiraceae bacterium]MCB9268538.1 hypothetical protein [Lewinellaceae bacterium]HPG07699.1 hypothetical protein [Saprospiraceae bacterium]HPR01950.1 hypothetical protein [Saprospiraceae bacterium]HRV86327.1 hypothetical protein [Saprospiraceae bacterium]
MPLHPHFERNVFINCPFDDDYFLLLKPLLFTIIYFEFEPRIALESSDSGNARLAKIIQLIRESQFSIHDLSRLRAKKIDDFYRLNMPFELGIDFGARNFDPKYHSKRALVLEAGAFDYMKAISDINGYDIKSHHNNPEVLIACLRSWFAETVGKRGLNASSKIYDDFIVFNRDMFDHKTLKYKSNHTATEAEHFARLEIDELTIPEYIDEVKDWLQKTNNRPGK